jgi:iron(III) transport system permease protein
MNQTVLELSLERALFVIIAVLVLYPVAWILWVSITPLGHVSLLSYAHLFTEGALLRSFVNSIGVATASSLIALLFGVPLAFIAVRTDLRYRGFISLFAMVPFITPAFIGGLAWVVLGAPRTGLLNLAGGLLGLSGPWLNVYSMHGVIFTLGIYMSPYVFVLTSAVLAAIDPTLEEAAAVSGSTTFGVIRSVAFPLATPGIAAAALIAFLNSAEQFGIPAILGRPANVSVLPTEIYSLMNRLPPDSSQASAAATLLLLLSAAAVVLQQNLTTRRSYVTVTGKGFRQRRFDLGRWRYSAYALVGTYAVVAVVLPIVALLLSSFLAAGTFSLSGNSFTLQHYVYLFRSYPATSRSLLNGFIYSVTGATVALLLAALSAYFISRYRSVLTRSMRIILMFPLVLPGIVIGTGLLLAYIRPPIVLYGTLWILVVSYITRFLPFAERASSAALQQIAPSLEEASAVCGASWLRTLWTVLLPLMRPALIGGWLLLFVSMIRELGTSVLLYSFGHEVPAVVLFDLLDSGNIGAMSAYANVLVAISIAIVFGFQKLLRSEFAPSG